MKKDQNQPLHELHGYWCGLCKCFQMNAMHRVFNDQAANVKPPATECMFQAVYVLSKFYELAKYWSFG